MFCQFNETTTKINNSVCSVSPLLYIHLHMHILCYIYTKVLKSLFTNLTMTTFWYRILTFAFYSSRQKIIILRSLQTTRRHTNIKTKHSAISIYEVDVCYLGQTCKTLNIRILPLYKWLLLVPEIIVSYHVEQDKCDHGTTFLGDIYLFHPFHSSHYTLLQKNSTELDISNIYKGGVSVY